MPTYDYKCTKCNLEFERFQRITEDPIKTCPECNGPVKRLIGGGTGIIFKGSGFYVTDNKKSSITSTPVSNNNKKDSKTETKSETKTETRTTETKTAVKDKNDKS
jgi:putative FmdB family regulatory protein